MVDNINVFSTIAVGSIFINSELCTGFLHKNVGVLLIG